jgi:signal transduction histidine kinase
MVGVVFDITQRKQIEHEHLELSGRLIKAHEEERSRIARELHDDFSQRVALLAGELHTILDALGSSQPKTSERARELVKTVNEFGADVHALSHRLHSPKLEMLGLSRSVSFGASPATGFGPRVPFRVRVPRQEPFRASVA